MTLHDTTETAKKFFIGSIFGILGLLSLVVLFRIGIIIKDILFPPQLDPPNMAYGELPPLHFPPDAVTGNYTYDLDTDTGTLPNNLTDRLNVFPILPKPPGLNSLETLKENIRKMGLISKTGDPIQETPLGNDTYEWVEKTGINKKVIYNSVTFDFTITSNYLESISVQQAQKITTQNAAVAAAQSFLGSINQWPSDINLSKTNIADQEKPYYTTPTLYNIINGVLEQAPSLSSTKVIRVNFYQNDLEYDLPTGLNNADEEPETARVNYPILYPNPPFSTMNLMFGSVNEKLEIVAAEFTHQGINRNPDTPGTYPIKSATEAYDELRSGKGYVAANPAKRTEIIIKRVYLAYYLGVEKQEYLMPIYVFEGQDGFFAYVSAVAETAIQSSDNSN